MNPKVRLIVEFMKSNLRLGLSVSNLCDVTGLSASRVHQMVKAELGVPPLRYHRRLRLEKAAELLRETMWKVERIRIEVGYRGHGTFFRDFKAEYGITPAQYRARHINEKLEIGSAEKKSRINH